MRSLHDYYINLIERGFVLAALDETPKELGERILTTPHEVISWLALSKPIGLVSGRNSAHIAIEVRNHRGHMVLSSWHRGSYTRTWEYVVGDSLYKIYKIPESFPVHRRITFLSEEDRDEPDLIVYGDESVVPLPALNERFKAILQTRPPETLEALGGLPVAPENILYALQSATVRKVEPSYLDSDVQFFRERNIMDGKQGRINVKTVYDVYQQETYEQGYEPREFGIFQSQLRETGITIKKDRDTGGVYLLNCRPIPFSRLDITLRTR